MKGFRGGDVYYCFRLGGYDCVILCLGVPCVCVCVCEEWMGREREVAKRGFLNDVAFWRKIRVDDCVFLFCAFAFLLCSVYPYFFLFLF